MWWTPEKEDSSLPGTMHSVQQLLTAACLLTVFVTLATGNAIQGSIQVGKSKQIESDQSSSAPDSEKLPHSPLPFDEESALPITDPQPEKEVEGSTEDDAKVVENPFPVKEESGSESKNNSKPVRGNADFEKLGEGDASTAGETRPECPPQKQSTGQEIGNEIKGNPSEDEVPKSEESKVTYNGLKVVRVAVRNKEEKKMLKRLENKGDISTWMGNGTAVDILVRENNVFGFLNEKKLSYDVVIDDLQRAIEEENPPPIAEDEWSELEGRKGHRMTWQMYHRMRDIHGYLDYLTATYPDICSQETIGYSVESKPLKVLKISSGKSDAKAVWVDSGIHAREWITPATSTYAISRMVESGEGSHGVDWYFLPLVNPDGYEHSHTRDRLWRKNRSDAYKGPCAGTDLNRNFGYHWGGQGSSQLPCRETYAGSGPFSEPETDAIRRFVSSKSGNVKAYISLHSYGQYILYPWGYDRKVPPDYADLHRVGRAMADAMKMSGGQNYRVGSAAATLYPASGGSDDWAKAVAKVKYTYTIELRDTGRHGFILPAQYILPTAREAYEALKVVAREVTQL